jgi:hypothetical protein
MPTIEPEIPSKALFARHVAIAYAQTLADEASFQAVHLGHVALSITCSAANLSGTVTLVVETPAGLGSAHPEVDALIYPLAHKTGILPQYIKAQMRQESFDKTTGQLAPWAYRYEPLASWVGDYGMISRKATPGAERGNLRATEAPYTEHRFATVKDSANDALAQGVKLNDADKQPRTIYTIRCDPGEVPTKIEAEDQLVSAAEIVRCNDEVHKWSRQNKVNAEKLERDDFTAQSSMAASYGYMQVTYVNALDNEWAGITTGEKNPTFLFDTEGNRQVGGGSLDIGTRIMTIHFREVLGGKADSPSFPYSTALDQKAVDAWIRYNGRARYGSEVLEHVPFFLPLPAGLIFPMAGGSQ